MMASAAVKLSSPAGVPPPAGAAGAAAVASFAAEPEPALEPALEPEPASAWEPASASGAGFSFGFAASAPTSGLWLAWSAAAELEPAELEAPAPSAAPAPAASSSAGSSVGASVTSASMTTSWSRSTLYTGKLTPATAMERCARLVNVGELARPTSMICSTRPNRSSWVSIQRTGEANCQDNSSTSSRRASFCGSMFAASMLSRRPDGARAAVASTKSWVSANGLATRFGT